jgi:uncharacterized membrane protein
MKPTRAPDKKKGKKRELKLTKQNVAFQIQQFLFLSSLAAWALHISLIRSIKREVKILNQAHTIATICSNRF